MTPPDKPNSSPELTEVEQAVAFVKTKLGSKVNAVRGHRVIPVEHLNALIQALSSKNELPSEIEGLRLQLGEALNAIDRIYGVTLSNNSPAGKLLSIESIVMAALNPKDTER
jgi:hypothetical protein